MGKLKKVGMFCYDNLTDLFLFFIEVDLSLLFYILNEFLYTSIFMYDVVNCHLQIHDCY